jgi:hypothetical protein
MGYIGLLLNAPYKIDSMVWMRCRLCSHTYSGLYASFHSRLNKVEGKMGEKALNGGNQGFWGYRGFWGRTLVLGILEVSTQF